MQYEQDASFMYNKSYWEWKQKGKPLNLSDCAWILCKTYIYIFIIYIYAKRRLLVLRFFSNCRSRIYHCACLWDVVRALKKHTNVFIFERVDAADTAIDSGADCQFDYSAKLSGSTNNIAFAVGRHHCKEPTQERYW